MIPLSIAFSIPKILVSLFLTSLTWWMRKISLHKIVGNLLDNLQNFYMNGTII